MASEMSVCNGASTQPWHRLKSRARVVEGAILLTVAGCMIGKGILVRSDDRPMTKNGRYICSTMDTDCTEFLIGGNRT